MDLNHDQQSFLLIFFIVFFVGYLARVYSVGRNVINGMFICFVFSTLMIYFMSIMNGKSFSDLLTVFSAFGGGLMCVAGFLFFRILSRKGK
jgi:hypothetical protein